MNKSIVLECIRKAYVKPHTRKTKAGKQIQVQGYSAKRLRECIHRPTPRDGQHQVQTLQVGDIAVVVTESFTGTPTFRIVECEDVSDRQIIAGGEPFDRGTGVTRTPVPDGAFPPRLETLSSAAGHQAVRELLKEQELIGKSLVRGHTRKTKAGLPVSVRTYRTKREKRQRQEAKYGRGIEIPFPKGFNSPDDELWYMGTNGPIQHECGPALARAINRAQEESPGPATERLVAEALKYYDLLVRARSED